MKKAVIITTLFLLLGITAVQFISYKIYTIKKIEIDKTNMLNETIETNYIENNSYKIEIKNLSIDHLFLENYTKITNDDNKSQYIYVKKDDNDTVLAGIIIEVSPSITSSLCNNYFEMREEDSKLELDKDLEKIFKKNNINNDLDLLYYLKENYYFKGTIFTPYQKLKTNYLLNKIIETNFNEFKSIIEIKGSLTGYILKNDFYTIIHLLNNTNSYNIFLSGTETLTNDYLISLLNSINIHK